MKNFMSIGEDFLNAQLFNCASEKVLYYRHEEINGVLCDALIGQSFFKVDDVTGFTVRERSIDFIIQSSQLDFAPEKGDVIMRGDKKYEVLAPQNEPCWRYSGGNMDTYRIHTKAIPDV